MAAGSELVQRLHEMALECFPNQWSPVARVDARVVFGTRDSLGNLEKSSLRACLLHLPWRRASWG
jgi:hypothetical protein